MIGNRLKEERDRLGMTQPAFAEVAGAAKRTLIEWEKGTTSPSAVQLSALHAIGVDLQYVLLGVRTPKQPQQSGITLHEVGDVVLTLDEAVLLDNYRRSQPDGQAAIQATSAALAQRGKKGEPV